MILRQLCYPPLFCGHAFRRLGVHRVLPSGGSVFRRPPSLLTGSLGMVRLLSSATMRPLRLPLSISPGSLLSPGDTLLCPALSLAQHAGSLAARLGVGVPVSPQLWLFSEGERR